MSFCKTEVNRETDDGIGSIYQSKIDSSLNSDSNVKEGVCYFLKSRLPTAEGTVNGRKVEVLRDTGCTCCTVKRSLVSGDQLIGKESYVTLIDETTQKYPLAVTDVDCPFFTGKTEALCMEDILYDLVIGNIDGSKLPDMSHFYAAAVTRSQTDWYLQVDGYLLIDRQKGTHRQTDRYLQTDRQTNRQTGTYRKTDKYLQTDK